MILIELATLLVRSAYHGESFFAKTYPMTHPLFTKPVLSIDKQIALLEDKGLIFNDVEVLKKDLKNISHFRLRGYWSPFLKKENDYYFDEEITFDKIVQLYSFDRKLRLILFDAMERIEIAIRTKLIYYLSIELGHWWFENAHNFINPQHHYEVLEEIDKELSRSKEIFIRSHIEKYGVDKRPPAYKTLEIVSFGCLSKLYQNLNGNDGIKKRIALELHLPNYLFLQSWLKSFNVIRNIIAHHSRLWNRNIDFPPRTLHATPHPFIKIPENVHSMYHCISCILFVLNKVSEDHGIKEKIHQLINDSQYIDFKEMGFPEDWYAQPIWEQ